MGVSGNWRVLLSNVIHCRAPISTDMAVRLGSLYSWMVKGIAVAFEAIAAMKSPLKWARDHFIFSLFYLTGLRTFEATAADMRTLRRALNGQRWLIVHGKRNKRREVLIA